MMAFQTVRKYSSSPRAKKELFSPFLLQLVKLKHPRWWRIVAEAIGSTMVWTTKVDQSSELRTSRIGEPSLRAGNGHSRHRVSLQPTPLPHSKGRQRFEGLKNFEPISEREKSASLKESSFIYNRDTNDAFKTISSHSFHFTSNELNLAVLEAESRAE